MATAQQIRDLRGAAAEHGDLMQVALCDLALDGAVDPDTYAALAEGERQELARHYGVYAGGVTQSVVADGIAWRECERQIADLQE